MYNVIIMEHNDHSKLEVQPILSQEIKSSWLRDLPRMVSVDVETAGPNPADYALLSIGACTLMAPRQEFYVELVPDKEKIEERAFAIHGLSFQHLKAAGKQPREAMMAFRDWLHACMPQDGKPLFLGFNAPFDWMFVCDYFHHYLRSNPFGHSAVDIKSFYMGISRVAWEETSMASLSTHPLRHNALEDARDQADIFLKILQDAGVLKPD